MPDIIQHAKFYTSLSEIEKQLNECADLGTHLQVETELTEKLVETADAIREFIKKQSDSNIFRVIQ